MNPSQRDVWPPPPPPPQIGIHHQRNDQTVSRVLGPPGLFGSTTPQAQQGGPTLPPPPGAFYQGPGSNGPSLPSLGGMTQISPAMNAHRTPITQHEQVISSQPQQLGGYSLHAIHQSSPSQPMLVQQAYDREREAQEARQREAREREYEQNRREQQRIREDHEREMLIRERQQREQHTPRQNPIEPLHIHQPVAVGPQMRTAIHGPNGLLANSGPPASQNMTSVSLFNGLPNAFTPDLETPPRRTMQQPLQLPLSSMMSFGGNPNSNGGPGPMSQGQQPILNDALSYLDQVKVQFSTEPNVYNQFLDIMKDFKSQSIDTPGVIRRVSSLFVGHPNLIQGFNTFLPPGYRIECGTADDPHAIRVTTPMGTTVSPMGSTLEPIPASRSTAVEGHGGPLTPAPEHIHRGSNGAWIQQPNTDRADDSYSPEGRRQNLQPFSLQYGQNHSQTSAFDPIGPRDHSTNAALPQHQQDQRGVSQLQNAVSAASAEPVERNGVSPLMDAAGPLSGMTSGANMVSQQGPRGPVEFNHAISYVNKIKNRFAPQPEIYKQFLEILQTYQRESKPIGDVYAQVTNLFNGAPDLLEDFKQFLPESAAHAKAAAAKQAAEDATMLSNVRTDMYSNQSGPSRVTPRPEQHRMPPIGNFAPTPSAARDAKRKRQDRQANVAGFPGNASVVAPDFGHVASSVSKNGFGPSKRSKPSQQPVGKAPAQSELSAISPTLVPALPKPMPPLTTSAATSDELAFFDRVKKFIANKSTMNDFLKLCNLYSQDLIDKNLLVFRAQSFIGSNPDLFNWFKNFVKYDGRDNIIENRARPPTGRISLNNCRLVGSSYRYLPKRERLKPCSGRDELCNSVLNDEWASHPTWASEDSGFVAHRKNIHEEGLHKIEEERHDYDYNIAVLERTIQMLEPLAQQNRMMSPAERLNWTLPDNMGDQSLAIYKKVLAKIYGREQGRKVLEHLITAPTNVVPVLLTRCRLTAEQWKASQREWEKVWRDQTRRMFWKSLDHQGINAKQADKRQFQAKTLQNEIHVKYEEHKRLRLTMHKGVPHNQAEYSFTDRDVLMDASHLVLIYAENVHSPDLNRLTNFIKDFVPLFFGLNSEAFEKRIRDVFQTTTPSNEEPEEDVAASEESSVSRGRKLNGKKGDLLRDVLEKGRKPVGNDKEGSLPSGSRASTPGTDFAVEEDMPGAVEESPEEEANTRTWMVHPVDGTTLKQCNIKPNEPYKRQTFNLYANLPIYCFFRMFVILYDRLQRLKMSEREVHDTVRRAKASKAAIDLKMADKSPDSFFADTSPGTNYYIQMLQMLEEQVKGESGMEMSHIEEVLRRFYLQNGWMLYSFDKMLGALVRFAIAILSNESKDKSYEIVQLFLKDRKKEMSTHQDELAYRRQVEKYVKDGDIYRIAYSQNTSVAAIRILKKDDLTFPHFTDTDGLFTVAQRWAYYVSAYASIEPTEGVPRDSMYEPIITRNLRVAKARSDDVLEITQEDTERLYRLKSQENLELKVSPDSYIVYVSTGSQEWWIVGPGAKTDKRNSATTTVGQATSRTDGVATVTHTEGFASAAAGSAPAGEEQVAGDDHGKGEHDHDEAQHDASGRFEEMFVMNNKWMAGLTKDEVDGRNADYRAWRGELPGTENQSEDAVMTY